ncbi:putative sodium/metabolite cotransporter BASS1, chloroplastic isoform X1 [Gossypium australe]|uniref:Putative sodium/metabolite cotransporter BASS1, chloroplastic isoform X1 n=1 Tax=Gossypium australe TaxID=47621 RepID=A0A5B6V2K5_9ROSI|nr:putative sodium/metabolite cotransporter BASS1, chloroplastic isoform X1 [Gossypium australe]
MNSSFFTYFDQILFGCVAQHTIMPTFAMVISKSLGLSPSLSVGLILLGCCPGGAASTVVRISFLILTPLLTMVLAGTYVPVDVIALSISTLQVDVALPHAIFDMSRCMPLPYVLSFDQVLFQVVVAPVLLGSYLQSTFPLVVKMITPFAPLFAVLLSSLLACRFLGLLASIFSGNVVRFKSSIVNASLASDASLVSRLQSLLSGDLGAVILSVMLLHFTGFFIGSGVGLLATTHFTSPVVALPPAMSAVIMNIMGSSLGFFWRQISGSKQELEDQE